MLAPVRLGQILVDPGTLEVLGVWAEGGGAAIALGPPTSVSEAGLWAMDERAAAVLVRRRGDPQAFWWGPGPKIPLNELDVLPLSRLVRSPVAARQGTDPAEQARGSSRHASFWNDRAWSSQNPEADERTRPVLPGDLAGDLTEEMPAVPPGTQVTVRRYDMFGEGPPFLRGVIRTWSIEGVPGSRADSEDSVNPFFHAGPPKETSPG